MCVRFVYMNSGACGVQKKVSNSLEFEPLAFGIYVTWVLKNQT